ncbi:Tyrosine recombinase XerD [Rhodobacteraceae bacterium IMCC1933]|jgi:integrase/recombinase XerD|nr:Tyrosine recombinase XerD [Rhodobacteraceae bacterium IMCC1923]MDP4069468.1 Tyrosine recombinase XerD [Rhodobacteraceae bacterium IMCC1933]MDP4072611.1 Tyrosine recombinase XerD [Rhodobacteraceae bacterium IMCC1909]
MAQAQTLTDAQLRRCLKWCQMRRHSARDTTIFYVSYYAGLRAKEIAALTVGDVYDEQGSVREQFALDAVQTKGAKTRTVWINAKLRRQLELYRSSLLFKDSNRALFQSQKGGAFSANTMTQLFLNIYRAAGFKNASSHSGRRTFITELASKGVSVRVLAELAGHSSIQTTQRYIDVNPQQMSAAVELL